MKHSTAVRWAHGILDGDGSGNYQRHGECDDEEDAAEQSVEGDLRRGWRDFVHRLMVCATRRGGHSISSPSSPSEATPAALALRLRVVDARAQLRCSSQTTTSARAISLGHPSVQFTHLRKVAMVGATARRRRTVPGLLTGRNRQRPAACVTL